MKFVLPVFATLTLLGCSHETSPTAPNTLIAAPSVPASSSMTSLWGFVVEPSGRCIDNATVEVVRGQAQGQRITQETPCDAWDSDGGFVFKGLLPGVEMTLRASAPGWSTEEKTVVPHSGVQTAVLIPVKKL